VTVTAHRRGCSAGPDGPDYTCLNASLASTARSAKPLPANPSAFEILGDGAPDKVGTFSFTGVAEQLGANFGKSPFPQRPPPPAYYAPPLAVPPRAR
jgi:hypothetical protein